MIDIRLKRWAQTLVHYSLKIQKGDRLVIRAKSSAEPLIREVYREAIRAGAFVDVFTLWEGFDKIYLDEAHAHQLAKPTPMESFIYEKYNKVLVLWGEANTRELTRVPPERSKKHMLGRKKLRQRFHDREAAGQVQWCLTEYPTLASAQEASMSREEYEDFVLSACACDRPDPIAFWKKVSREQAKIAARLNRVREIRIVSKDTDITASVAGRKWVNCDGRINFPDGEIFTSPVETEVNGHIRFSFPGIYQGREIEDIRLEFKDGKVTKASALKGEELLHTLLKVDEGATRLGELAIGTNYGIQDFTRNILFDEKIGGTVHLAVGSGFPEAGSKNKSVLHWNMICDMRQGGRIYADGRLIYRDGRFLPR